MHWIEQKTQWTTYLIYVTNLQIITLSLTNNKREYQLMFYLQTGQEVLKKTSIFQKRLSNHHKLTNMRMQLLQILK